MGQDHSGIVGAGLKDPIPRPVDNLVKRAGPMGTFLQEKGTLGLLLTIGESPPMPEEPEPEMLKAKEEKRKMEAAGEPDLLRPGDAGMPQLARMEPGVVEPAAGGRRVRLLRVTGSTTTDPLGIERLLRMNISTIEEVGFHYFFFHEFPAKKICCEFQVDIPGEGRGTTGTGRGKTRTFPSGPARTSLTLPRPAAASIRVANLVLINPSPE